MIRYFAYGSDLHVDSIIDWCRHADRPLPWRNSLRPAVLAHHRICFPTYESFWQGGVADITHQPGKMVSGALMELSRHGLETLQLMAGRSRSQQTKVWVTPYVGGPPVEAIAFRTGLPDICHIPPSRRYLDRLTQAAADVGLSMMWIMHLNSFSSTQPAEAKEATAKSMAAPITIERLPSPIRRRTRPNPVHSDTLQLAS
jgi:hypothetical protein